MCPQSDKQLLQFVCVCVCVWDMCLCFCWCVSCLQCVCVCLSLCVCTCAFVSVCVCVLVEKVYSRCLFTQYCIAPMHLLFDHGSIYYSNYCSNVCVSPLLLVPLLVYITCSVFPCCHGHCTVRVVNSLHMYVINIVSMSLCLSVCLSLPSLSLTHTHTHTLSLCLLCLSVSLFPHSLSLSHTHTLSLSFFPFSLSLSQIDHVLQSYPEPYSEIKERAERTQG